MTDVAATLAERGGRYGKFADHAAIAQGLQEVLQKAPNWSKLDPDMRQALCVITDKMARILNGDPYYDDNWHDIQGYAKLVEARIREMVEQQTEANAPTFDPLSNAEARMDNEGGAMLPVTPDITFVENGEVIPRNRLEEGGAGLKQFHDSSFYYDKSEQDCTNVGEYRG